MQAKPLELHPGAEEDCLNTLTWYRDRNSTAAEKFDAAFGERSKQWKMRLSVGQFISLTFADTLHQFPFSLIYRVESARTFVLALAHGRRRPGYWKDRA